MNGGTFFLGCIINPMFTVRCWLNESFLLHQWRHQRLRFKRLELFGRSLFLGLPQVAVDGDSIYIGRHGLGRDVAELLLV